MATKVPAQDEFPSATTPKRKRIICDRCHRPKPTACLCSALPESPIRLDRCHCLVLQHPHEVTRKNSSLPLVLLCLSADSITVEVARRLGHALTPRSLEWFSSCSPSSRSLSSTSLLVNHVLPEKSALDESAARKQHASLAMTNTPSASLLIGTPSQRDMACRDDCHHDTVSQEENISLGNGHPHSPDEHGMAHDSMVASALLSSPASGPATAKDTSLGTSSLSITTTSPRPRPTVIWLMAPGPQSMSLGQAVRQLQDDDFVLLVFLDATWKHAQEMDQANIELGHYPADIVRVEFRLQDLDSYSGIGHSTGGSATDTATPEDRALALSSLPQVRNHHASPTVTPSDETNTFEPRVAPTFRPRRFGTVRTPPSDQHLSTAECLAWAASSIHGEAYLFHALMKPLDLMVKTWNAHYQPASSSTPAES